MPVILAKTTLGSVKIKDFKLLIFGYFLNVMLSKSLFDPAKLRGYEVRICAFLAERFMPYWFRKYTKR